jgi:nicotinate-nucleotide adenylyltransferase
VSAVGVLGGTFDPVHRGHIALACGVREALGLSRVLLVPCAIPPHKPDRPITATYHRLELLYLASEGIAGLAVDTIELVRGGISYSIDTLRTLRASGLDPVFVLGSDALAEISSWRDHRALLSEFDFASVERPQGEGPSLPDGWPEEARRRVSSAPETPSETLGRGGRIVRIPLDVPSVSSSVVRARSEGGADLAPLVPPRVARYIQRHRLYR